MMQPVYQYISEKYKSDRLIDMYYHFVSTNRDILDRTKNGLLSESIRQVIASKNILNGFEQDPYYDILADYHKMVTMQADAAYGSGMQSGVLCFSPADLAGQTALQFIKKNLTIVTYIRMPGGKLKTIIKSRR